MADIALTEFAAEYDSRYPTIFNSCRCNWENLAPFFAYPPDIRKAIYTKNAIESINSVLRKTINNTASFPTDEAAVKLFYLSIRMATKRFTMSLRNWGLATNQFAIHFDGPKKWRLAI